MSTKSDRNETKTTTVKIGSVVVNIVTRPNQSRFGILWTSESDYGEPKNETKGFKTARESLNNEIDELSALAAEPVYYPVKFKGSIRWVSIPKN